MYARRRGLEVGLDGRQVVLRAGDHRLIEGVEVRDVETPAGVARREHRFDPRRLRTDHRSHPTATDFAHHLATPADEREARGEVEGTRRVERVELAEAVAGHKRRGGRAAFDAHAIGHRVDDEERGLRERRLPELAARIVHAELADRVADNRVGLARPLANRSNNSAPIPFDCEPWPGKMHAVDIRSKRWSAAERDILSQCLRPRHDRAPTTCASGTWTPRRSSSIRRGSRPARPRSSPPTARATAGIVTMPTG
jgi:hypothetical protein